MSKSDYPVLRPVPPTSEELADFEAWKSVYESVLAHGDERGWLSYHMYCEGAPDALSPAARYEERLRRWKAERAIYRNGQKELARKRLQERADIAAEKARRRVLEGRD